jgi:hypothetical protein
MKDQDIKAEAKEAFDCPIVVVKQFDGRDPMKPSWRTITVLFPSSKEKAEKLAEAITEIGME